MSCVFQFAFESAIVVVRGRGGLCAVYDEIAGALGGYTRMYEPVYMRDGGPFRVQRPLTDWVIENRRSEKLQCPALVVESAAAARGGCAQ